VYAVDEVEIFFDVVCLNGRTHGIKLWEVKEVVDQRLAGEHVAYRVYVLDKMPRIAVAPGRYCKEFNIGLFLLELNTLHGLDARRVLEDGEWDELSALPPVTTSPVDIPTVTLVPST
jgi:hypothetical protein